MHIVLIVAGLLIIVAACAYFAWTYGDYIVAVWSWTIETYNAFVAHTPEWVYPVFGALLLLAFIGALLKLL